jgi:hypothetical protein
MQQLFDELIGTPPPSAIDPRALVRRDRRNRATYRTIGATATVAVLGVATVLVTSAAIPAGAPPAAVGSPAVASPDDRFELRAATRAEADLSAGQLASALNDAVHTAVPGAVWRPGPGITVTVIDYVSPPGWYGSGTLHVAGTGGSFTATADTVPGFDGTCATLPAPHYPKGREPIKPEPPRQCQDVRTPAGAPVVLLAGDPGPEQTLQLRTPLPAGRVLSITVTGAPPVLTVEQALQVMQLAAARIR